MSDSLVYRLINDYFAGIVSEKVKRVPIYFERHTFCNHLLNNGRYQSVKELLGHS